jgi:bacterioferritin-associated ferredoxin
VLLCHCHVVSDRTVRAVAQAGAVDVDAVTSLCGAGGDCGGCVPAIEDLLAEAALAVREPERLRQRQRQRRVAVPSVAVAR